MLPAYGGGLNGGVLPFFSVSARTTSSIFETSLQRTSQQIKQINK